MAFLVVAALVAGFLTGLPALYGMGAGLAGYALLGWIESRLSLAGVDADRDLYPSAFEGDAVDVGVWLKNRSWRSLYLLEIYDRFGPSLATRQSMLQPGPLRPNMLRRLTYRGVCGKHWGEYPCGPITLSLADPMGFFNAEADVLRWHTFSVFPRVHEIPWLHCRGSRASLIAQESSIAAPGQGALYLGIRDYRSGDDMRRVHWAAMARLGHPMVLEMELDMLPSFTLFVDFEARWRAGLGRLSTSEFVMRSAASLLWSAMQQGAVFQIFGESKGSVYQEPGSGANHLTHCLHQLLPVAQEGEVGILDLVDRYRAAMPRGSVAAILSASIELDPGKLDNLLEELIAAEITPLVVAVNNYSFRQVEGFVRPPEEVEELVSTLELTLRRHTVSGIILNPPLQEGERALDLAEQLTRGQQW